MILVGTRPEIIKVAPLIRVFARRKMAFCLVHSGQHYDYAMSAKFFDDLELPSPDFSLKTKMRTPVAQTAEVMTGFERIIGEVGPGLIIVQGDTNTTLAGGLAAIKSGVPVAHVEAGLRSYDMRMQEEYNRIVVDHISEYLFAPTRMAKRTLLSENVWGRAYTVGNTAIDACIQHATMAARKSRILESLRFKRYALATLHRAENVDDPKSLAEITAALMEAPVPIVIPLHPRTAKRLKENGLWINSRGTRTYKSYRPWGTSIS
jgi:UDP-N-acetylglucosamine 2-epimerase (non-hydrolysing)